MEHSWRGRVGHWRSCPSPGLHAPTCSGAPTHGPRPSSAGDDDKVINRESIIVGNGVEKQIDVMIMPRTSVRVPSSPMGLPPHSLLAALGLASIGIDTRRDVNQS